VLNAYTVTLAALLLPAGRWGDRIGHRRLSLISVAVFTLASLLCALAPTLGLLIAARVQQAVGAAAQLPTSLVLLMEAFPPERRTHAVRLWSAVGAVAAAFGPVLGGLLVTLSWRRVFVVNVPVGIAAVAVGMLVLPHPAVRGGKPLPDALGAVLLAVGVAALRCSAASMPNRPARWPTSVSPPVAPNTPGFSADHLSPAAEFVPCACARTSHGSDSSILSQGIVLAGISRHSELWFAARRAPCATERTTKMPSSLRSVMTTAAAAAVLLLSGATAASAAVGTPHPASPLACTSSAATLQVNSFGFVPSQVGPGDDSAAVLVASNCTELALATSQAWTGVWVTPTGTPASAVCPAIDPLTQSVAYAAEQQRSTSTTYLVPVGCNASGLKITVTITSGGTQLATASAVLSIKQ
jgi:MFS family permease